MEGEIEFRGLDGTRLSGTLETPSDPIGVTLVLLHGNGTDRQELGLFTRLAQELATRGISSLRFDLRGHGASGGLQEDRTLSAHLNDVQAALAMARELTGSGRTGLLATSFSGGVATWYAAHRAHEVDSLVLLNPQLDHRTRFIDEKPWWVDDVLDDEHAQQLDARGYLDHAGSVRTGRAMLNEVFWIRACTVLDRLQVPTLLLHGTEDILIPIDSSRSAAARIAQADLVEFPGAAHGLSVPGDGRYLLPQTRAWQRAAFAAIASWVLDLDVGLTG